MKISKVIEMFMGFQRVNSGEKNNQELQAVF